MATAVRRLVKRLACVAGWSIVGVCLPWGLWWYYLTPTPGKAGVLLALVATLMPLVWDDVREIGRAGLILTLVILFAVEYRAIDKERKDYADDQAAARKEEKESFKRLLDSEEEDVRGILDQEKADVKNILTQEEKHFEGTMANSRKALQSENAEFAAVLTSEKQLFESEEQLFQSLNGQLFPANDQMPKTLCGAPPKDSYLVAVNGDGHMFTKFPHVILFFHRQKTLWLDKREDGSIALFVDLKDPDRRIAVRIDKDGFFIHPGTKFFARRPDKSSLVIQNEFGENVLSVRYVNPQAFEITENLGGRLGPRVGCVVGDYAADEIVD